MQYIAYVYEMQAEQRMKGDYPQLEPRTYRLKGIAQPVIAYEVPL